MFRDLERYVKATKIRIADRIPTRQETNSAFGLTIDLSLCYAYRESLAASSSEEVSLLHPLCIGCIETLWVPLVRANGH
jgi:hypothetical protein